MCCFHLLAMNKSHVVSSAIPYHLSNPKISILISNFSRFDVYTDADVVLCFPLRTPLLLGRNIDVYVHFCFEVLFWAKWWKISLLARRSLEILHSSFFFTFIPDLEDFPLTIRFKLNSFIQSLLSFSIEVCDCVLAISWHFMVTLLGLGRWCLCKRSLVVCIVWST